MKTNIPKLKNIKDAIEIYYSNKTLGTKDISLLFSVGRNKALLLKKQAIEEMQKDNIPFWNALEVDTETAFKSWGIDIDDLKKRFRELEKLKSQSNNNERKVVST